MAAACLSLALFLGCGDDDDNGGEAGAAGMGGEAGMAGAAGMGGEAGEVAKLAKAAKLVPAEKPVKAAKAAKAEKVGSCPRSLKSLSVPRPSRHYWPLSKQPPDRNPCGSCGWPFHRVCSERRRLRRC